MTEKCKICGRPVYDKDEKNLCVFHSEVETKSQDFEKAFWEEFEIHEETIEDKVRRVLDYKDAKKLENEKTLNFEKFIFPDELADFRKIYFKKGTCFNKAIFKGVACFDGAKFTRYTTFRDVNFAGAARFLAANFEDARFNKANFAGVANFGGVKFKNSCFDEVNFCKALFTGAKFKTDTRFHNVNFNETVWFIDVNFKGVRFDGANFSGPAEFYSAKFGDVMFDGAKFRDVRFKKVNFTGCSTFSEVDFGNVEFIGANFRDVRFNRVKFTGDVRFDEVNFAGRVCFDDANFKRETNFSGAYFGLVPKDVLDITEFTSASYELDKISDDELRTQIITSLNKAVLNDPLKGYSLRKLTVNHLDNVDSDWLFVSKKNRLILRVNLLDGSISLYEPGSPDDVCASFHKARFLKKDAERCLFEGARFFGHVDFSSAFFGCKVIFTGSTNTKDSTGQDQERIETGEYVFTSNCVFKNVDIDKPDNLCFRSVYLGEASFHSSNLRNAQFVDVIWPKKEYSYPFSKLKLLKWSRVKVYEDDAKVKSNQFEYISEIYKELRLSYERNLKFSEQASDFHIGEMEMRKRNALAEGKRLDHILLWVYEQSSRYGERWWLPLCWLSFFCVLFSALMPFANLQIISDWTNYHWDWSKLFDLERLRISILTMLQQTTNPNPLVDYSKTPLGIIERIISIVLVASLVLGIQRKISRVQPRG